MRKPVTVAAFATLAVTLACRLHTVHAAQTQDAQPEKTVPVPADYREWVYLTSGLDMTYATSTAQPAQGHQSTFDNVFVNPEAWRAFKQTGTWPDGTTFVLENRTAEQNVSINRGGHTQSDKVEGVELHQKRKGEWSFYVLGPNGAEQLIAKPAGCYTCHEAHAAVDTTFAQFYPTAMPVAQAKRTVSKAYLAEQSNAAKK